MAYASLLGPLSIHPPPPTAFSPPLLLLLLLFFCLFLFFTFSPYSSFPCVCVCVCVLFGPSVCMLLHCHWNSRRHWVPHWHRTGTFGSRASARTHREGRGRSGRAAPVVPCQHQSPASAIFFRPALIPCINSISRKPSIVVVMKLSVSARVVPRH